MQEQKIEIKQLKAWYQNPFLWVGVGVTGCLILLAMPHVMRAYGEWSGRRYLHRAQDFYAKGEYQQAILNARGALARNPNDVEATRIIARTAEAMGSPQALSFRRQVDALKPGDTENLLAMAEGCLKTGDSTAAAGILESVRVEDRNSARYHDLAGGVALGNRDAGSAEKHWVEACRIEPANNDYRLKLASLQLNGRDAETRARALAVVEELTTKPEVKVTALRVLLGDAMTRGESAKARPLADALVAEEKATFSDKLTRLAILRVGKTPVFSALTAQRAQIDPEFSKTLEDMQASAVLKQEELYQLLVWMNEHDLALIVPEWLAKIPGEQLAKPPVCVAVADAYVRASDWKGLKGLIENANWQQAEFLRLALMFRALDRLGDVQGARLAWGKTITAAESRPETLEVLGKEVQRWGMEDKTEEVLQKLANAERCPRWATDALWKTALKRGNTMELYKVSRLVLKADPKNVPARNNYISLALLAGQDGNLPRQLAEALHKENPTDANVCSTYGLALYQEGKAEEAVALMEKLTPAQLHGPSVALYYGIFLAAAGRAEAADEYLQIGAGGPQLPEEKALGDFLRYAVRARSLEKVGDAAGSNASWTEARNMAQGNPDWLELLGRMALQWEWQERAGVVVLKLATMERCPRWASDTLWTASLKTGDSAQIYKAAKLIQTADPKNIQARTNFILAALLTRRDGDAPQRQIEALARENPTDALVVGTQALALLQQGKADNAVTSMAALKPEQLRDPQTAFYYGLALAVAGRRESAAAYLDLGTDRLQFPEEKTLLKIVRLALQNGDQGGSTDTAWSQALGLAEKRSDWLEMLARMALKTESPSRAETALWKLADDAECPLWAIDFLTAAAEKNRNTGQLYKASKLKSKAAPKDIAARSTFIRLALLTGHTEDFPHRLAEEFAEEYRGHPQAALSYGFSLYQRGKAKEAVAALAALKPEQQREPRTAYYYGLFLTADGQAGKAEEFLRIGAGAPLLPEEMALLTKVKLADGGAAAR